MTTLRILLVVIFLVVSVYTGLVFVQQGSGAYSIFVGDIARLSWPGQFNLDLVCFLVLAGVWLAWRHHFSGSGVLIGLAAFAGGAFFLCAYLLVMSFRVNGDVTALLIGETRAAAR